MKRSRAILAAVCLVPLIAGCGGGPEIGPPAEVKGTQTDEFKAAMEKAGGKMAPPKGGMMRKPAGAAEK
jgi:hypothetical protein